MSTPRGSSAPSPPRRSRCWSIFWAPWCAPCRVAAPLFDQVARQLRGDAIVLKVDTEANPAAAARYQIRAIPTAILFQEAREKERRMGVQPAPALETWLRAALDP
jgi:thioredoxin 2